MTPLGMAIGLGAQGGLVSTDYYFTCMRDSEYLQL
jgi:hypothetical protein